MKKIIALFGLVLSFPLFANAATFQSGEELYISETTDQDVYGAGGIVQLGSNVNGDLLTAGGMVNLDGVIFEDLLGAGGQVDVNGEVKGDARVLGGSIDVDALIGGDLILAGGEVKIDSETVVGADFAFATGTMFMNGKVNGNVQGYAGMLTINGEITGDMNLLGVEELRFGPDAKINGNLTYTSKKTAEIPENVVNGEVVYKKQILPSPPVTAGEFIAGFSVYSFLSLLVLGLLLMWLFRFFGLDSTDRALDSVFRSMGIGFLVILVAIVLTPLTLISIVGIPLSAILLASLVIILYLGKVYAAMIIGRSLVKIDQKSGYLKMLGSYSLGLLIFVLLTFVPIVGWILRCLLVLLAVGGMTLSTIEQFKILRKKKLV